LNILILAAGRMPATNDLYPPILTEIDSEPVIEKIIKSCKTLDPKNLLIACPEKDIKNYHLNNIFSLLWPGVIVISVQSDTSGAACTALLAKKQIDSEDELLIVNGNELLGVDFLKIVEFFRYSELDGGVVVFNSIHPRYSYVQVDDFGFVSQVAEKNPISTMATAGFYWFKRGNDFISGAQNIIRKDIRVNDLFYISPVFNELILNQKKIGVFQVDSNLYHPLKTGKQIEEISNLQARVKK
jgi:dTDP-glucose pyrophosphorylase